MILDLLNWHWKLKMSNFWQSSIKSSYKVSKNPFKRLIQMQKFIEFQLHHREIPQLSPYYCIFISFKSYFDRKSQVKVKKICNYSKNVKIGWNPLAALCFFHCLSLQRKPHILINWVQSLWYCIWCCLHIWDTKNR